MTLEELKRLTEAATAGPWVFCDHGDISDPEHWSVWRDGTLRRVCQGSGHRDGKLIAAARDAMPRLIAVAEAAAKTYPLAMHSVNCMNLPTGKRCICGLYDLGNALAALESPEGQ